MTPYRCQIFSTIEKPGLNTRQAHLAVSAFWVASGVSYGFAFE
jgi:hypothetical protein